MSGSTKNLFAADIEHLLDGHFVSRHTRRSNSISSRTHNGLRVAFRDKVVNDFLHVQSDGDI
jgi:hypothetical protein